MFLSSTILCLALLVYHEARNQPVIGQQAVMEVAYNRSKHKNYPNSVCSVVKQSDQFSWYKGSLKPPSREKESWEKSYKLASDFYTKKTNHTKGAIFFNTTRMGVRYKVTTENGKPCKIGGHIFY